MFFFSIVCSKGAVCFNKSLSSSAGNSLQADPKVARELLAAATSMVRAAGVASKDNGFVFSVDSAASLASNLDYNALLGRLSLLSVVELAGLSFEVCLAFWLNVYHLLLVVSTVELYPFSPKDRLRNARQCSLMVCGERLSLLQIEFAILRSSRAMPSLPASHLLGGALPKKHPKFAAVFDGIEDRWWRLISYGISYACSGTPAMHVYDAENVLEALQKCGHDYFSWGGGLKISKKNVVLSAYLEWFQGENDAKIPLETALATWSEELGLPPLPDNKPKIKFEDNVMLDEVLFFFPKTVTAINNPGGNNNNEVEGVHFSAVLSPRVVAAGKDKEETK